MNGNELCVVVCNGKYFQYWCSRLLVKGVFQRFGVKPECIAASLISVGAPLPEIISA